jgi:hypothetical protein
MGWQYFSGTSSAAGTTSHWHTRTGLMAWQTSVGGTSQEQFGGLAKLTRQLEAVNCELQLHDVDVVSR